MEFFGRHRALLLPFIFLIGVLSDFILVGVFKVIWIAIYGTTYLALAMTVENQIRNSKLKDLSKKAVFAFLGGALIAHLVFVNHRRQTTYAMDLISENPMIFVSSEFPELLYVTSEKLAAKVGAEHLSKGIPVHTEALTDYDCMKTFAIADVDGIDVREDKQANWVLRVNKVGVFTNKDLPSMNDDSWPWCKISFYRTQ